MMQVQVSLFCIALNNAMKMKNILKLEELAQLGLGLYLFLLLPFAWWWFLVLFLSPDVSMLGYLFGPKTGAFTYNLFHHKGLAIGIYLLGIYLTNDFLQAAGAILFAHAAFDRIMGYGLKYIQGFKHTHLGDL